jgi:hypothetical protein
MCDDNCPNCGARHLSPYDEDDLTLVVERDSSAFIVLRSPESAGYFPVIAKLAALGLVKKLRHSW